MNPKSPACLWLAANAIGMGLYLFFASALWVAPEDQGNPGGPGDAFVWLFTAFPVLLVFTVFNLVALFRIIKEYRRTKSLVPVLLWMVVCSVWLNVLFFDHIRGVRYIDSKYAEPGASADAPKAARL